VPALHNHYWPVPVTVMVCSDGVAASVTVIALARTPTALGVKVTVKVQWAWAASVEVQGVEPPGAAVYSPLPAIAGLTDTVRLLVVDHALCVRLAKLVQS
jgi:hypothetical protein